MTALWPWLTVAGLGIYHGVNPAMGWLFAVALGLHRRSRGVVLGSLIPIALGHALAIATVAGAALALGIFVEPNQLRILAGAILVGWSLYHLVRGNRHRLRVGMQTGLTGLFLWSFLMASAHGAGLMLVPALFPICFSGGATATRPLVAALAAVALHTATMLLVTGVIAVSVYQWIGLGFLRWGWINLDLIWSVALMLAGLALLLL
jgi:hypothetical protein